MEWRYGEHLAACGQYRQRQARLPDTGAAHGASICRGRRAGRLFLFAAQYGLDVQEGRAQMRDARSGRLLSGFSDSQGDPRVYWAAADESDQRVVAVTGSDDGLVDPHLLIFDSRTGRQLHSLTIPVARPPNAMPSGYNPSGLSYALDQRSGRLYIFGADRSLRVVDTRSRRILLTRRLRVALTGAIVDGRTGRIFAFDGSKSPMVTVTASPGNNSERVGTVVMLDASGAILRVAPGGTAAGWPWDIGLDEAANRLLILNPLSGAVDLRDAANGRLLRTVTVGAMPQSLVVDQRRHRAALVVDSGAAIVTLDTRDGAVLRRIAMPQHIQSLAVDAGTGCLIATATALHPLPPDRWGWLPGWLRSHLPGVPPPTPHDPAQRILTNSVLIIDPAR